MADGAVGPAMPFTYERPATAEAACRALAAAPEGAAVALAGGSDLLPDLDAGRLAPSRVISLADLPWRGLERRDGRLVIGSLRPLRAIEQEPGLAEDLPGFFEAVRAVGSPALRTRATLGGNIGRSAATSDLLPALLALAATAEIVGPAGDRSAPIEEILGAPRRPRLAPGELVRAIELPARARSAYVWQRVRPAHDISQVGVAVARPRAGEGWRVALGGAAPVPQRLPAAEAPLTAEEPPAEAIGAAAEAAAANAPFLSDRRASEAYRRRVVRVLTARALRLALAPPGARGESP